MATLSEVNATLENINREQVDTKSIVESIDNKTSVQIAEQENTTGAILAASAQMANQSDAQIKEQENNTAAILSVSNKIATQMEADEKSRLTNLNTRAASNSSSDVSRSVSGGGGLLGGILGGIGSLGTGIGVGALGLGALAAGAAYLLDVLSGFADFDVEKIKENVLGLLSISDAFTGGMIQFFAEGGLFTTTMAGIGAGLAIFGVGSTIVGLSEVINKYFGVENWAETVKENVLSLLSIADGISGNIGLLAEGAIFTAAMTGIGLGLGVFGVGSAIAGIGDAIARFSTPDWTEAVKENVLTLLSIADGISGNLGFIAEGGSFLAAMTGLAGGLAVFGAGSAIAGIGDAIARFSSPDWADAVKNNVLTLLSISDSIGGNVDLLGTSGTFLAAMTGIASGLAVFGAGSVISGITDAIATFANQDWAQAVKDNVLTLLSISDNLGGVGNFIGEGATFLAAMTGIAAGLAVFSAGSTFVGLTDLIKSEDWAEKVKRDVDTLLSVGDKMPDDNTFMGEGSKFFMTMSGIAAGLTAFAGAQFVGTISNAISAVLSFFTGAENPFDQLMNLAENADELSKGATALEKITSALNDFAAIKISGVDIDFEELAEGLGRAVPFLDALANGGPVKGSAGWFGSEIDMGKGLLHPSLRLDEMVEAISKVNYVLGRTASLPGETETQSVDSSILNEISREVSIVKISDEVLTALTTALMQRDYSERTGAGGGSSSTYIDQRQTVNAPSNSTSYVLPMGPAIDQLDPGYATRRRDR